MAEPSDPTDRRDDPSAPSASDASAGGGNDADTYELAIDEDELAAQDAAAAAKPVLRPELDAGPGEAGAGAAPAGSSPPATNPSTTPPGQRDAPKSSVYTPSGDEPEYVDEAVKNRRREELRVQRAQEEAIADARRKKRVMLAVIAVVAVAAVILLYVILF
jgi:hypothetical protein